MAAKSVDGEGEREKVREGVGVRALRVMMTTQASPAPS